MARGLWAPGRGSSPGRSGAVLQGAARTQGGPGRAGRSLCALHRRGQQTRGLLRPGGSTPEEASAPETPGLYPRTRTRAQARTRRGRAVRALLLR